MLFIGDIHGNFVKLQLLIDRFDFTDQTLIQVGDFGLGFRSLAQDIYDMEMLNKRLKERNSKMYVIRGNHDNPEYWKSMIHTFQLSNFKLVPDYTFMNIENKGIIFIGGGISIDRSKRDLDKSYWKNEAMIPNHEWFKTFNNNMIDIVVTHVPMMSVYPIFDNGLLNYYLKDDETLQEDIDTEQKLLSDYNELLLKKNPNSLRNWISGHMHMTALQTTRNIKHRILDIDEFFEIT